MNEPAGGSASTLDEPIAWDLVRRVSPGCGERSEPTRVSVGAGPAVWLEITPAGEWTASHPPTAGARDVFDLFVPLLLGRQIVIGQLGQSVDGRIATESGASHYVTGPQDLVRLHRLRALVDAVVVGASTVVADDPQLTVRRVEGDNPVRVVLDPRGRVGRDRRVFQDKQAPTCVVHAEGLKAVAQTEPDRTSEVESIPVPVTGQGQLDLSILLETLASRGLSRILVEGGGTTVSGFLSAGLLDRLHIAVAPLIIGSGRPSITLPTIESLDEAHRPVCRHFRLGEDVLFDFDLNSPQP